VLDQRWQFVGPALPTIDPHTSLPVTPHPDRPIIYISLGTLFNTDSPFYQLCLAALADLPVHLVLSIGTRTDPATLGELPPHVTVRPFVPQLALLQHTALFITHGGMNSVHEGLAQGVPLLVVPQAADQGMVAAQVQRLGAGLALNRSTVTAAQIRAAALQLLSDPVFTRRSAALGQELQAAGGARRAVELIEAYTRHQTAQPEVQMGGAV
jgi:MGT family glycosyltransferase